MDTTEVHRKQLLSLLIDNEDGIRRLEIIDDPELYEVEVWLRKEVVKPALEKALVSGKLDNF